MTTSNAVTLTQDEINTNKAIKAVKRTLAKPSIKAHARSLQHKLPVDDGVEALVVDDTLILSIGDHTEEITLTTHKSGSKYPHWIRLNRAIISLCKKAHGDDSVTVIKPISDEAVETVPSEDLSKKVDEAYKRLAPKLTEKQGTK
jgi:hypothetical protein